MTLAAGTRLGRYEIVARIGAGGMGAVYRARDGHLRRDVAIKVLHPGPSDDAARLLREARVVSTLNDPHIVTVHDADLPIEELQRVAIDIAGGLARAHAAGAVVGARRT